MLPSVASHWLIPRLARIRRRHPEVDVQVIADPRLLDLRAEGIDLAIRFGREPEVTGSEGARNIEVLEAAMKVPAVGPIGVEGDRGQMEYRRIRVKLLP
jgi:LysR family glycine cleavage system transcriptional activator